MAHHFPSEKDNRSNSGSSDPELDQVENINGLERRLTAFGVAKAAHDKNIADYGLVKLMPMPTPDPKDPLNLPTWQKFLAIGSLCLFGALAAAAELILGAMLPIFVFEYTTSDLWPGRSKWLVTHTIPALGESALSVLANTNLFPGPPIDKIYLLASLPILMMGVVNFFLVPLAISVGRRTILMVCGITALAACTWAGFSTSLESHLGARCLQALGAGTVESLIPFIIQDMVFAHQRNMAIGAVFAMQGLIVVALGISTPYIIANLEWRWVYWVTSIGGLFFWCLMFIFLPETKFERPTSEMYGVPSIPLEPGQHRPLVDHKNYTPRTWVGGMGIFAGKPDWRAGWQCFYDTMRTFFYPHIFFITILNSIMIAITLAAGYTVSPQLLAPPYSWPFEHLGFCLFPVIIAAGASYLISGFIAEKTANAVARRTGERNPEFQALNLLFPTIIGLIGCLLFGAAGEYPDRYPWPVFMIGFGFIAFGFLATNTIGIVYVLDAYPHLAGPALVNIASFRLVIAFLLIFRIDHFVILNGYLTTFAIYGGVLGFFILTIPLIYIYGASWRKRWPALPKDHLETHY